MAASPLRLSPTSPSYLALGASERAHPLPLGISTLDEALLDGGLPSGAVVELCAPSGLGGATYLALRACGAAQRQATPRPGSESEWVCWIDPKHPRQGASVASSLHAPAVARAGVDLTRLLVVRPDPDEVARIAVRIASSHLFRLIVVDRCGLPGVSVAPRARWSTVVRRLALAAQSSDTTILLLSPTRVARRELLPTALRIELSRPRHDHIELRVTKDRRGRLLGPVSVPVTSLRARAA